MSQGAQLFPGLVNFCMRLDDGPKDKSRKLEISEEKKKDLEWLRMVLDSVEPQEQQIKRLLGTLGREGLTEEECLKTLEELCDLVEDINWATEFLLMNGHNVILNFLRENELAAKSAKVRKQAGFLIANASQLHERMQKCFEDAKWCEVLVPLLKTEKCPAALAGLLHACSALCREYIPNAVAFCGAGGIDVLSTLLKTYTADDADSCKIIKRTMFLLFYLMSVINVDVHPMIESICMHARREHDDIQVLSAQVICFYLEKFPKAVKQVLNVLRPDRLRKWKEQSLAEDDPRLILLRKLNKQQQK